jgi:hypothetical protein
LATPSTHHRRSLPAGSRPLPHARCSGSQSTAFNSPVSVASCPVHGLGAERPQQCGGVSGASRTGVWMLDKAVTLLLPGADGRGAALAGSSAGREGRVVAATNGGALAGPGPSAMTRGRRSTNASPAGSGKGLGRGRSSTSRRRGGVDGVAGPIGVARVGPLDAALALGPDRLNGRHHHGHTVNRSGGPVSRERDEFGV